MGAYYQIHIMRINMVTQFNLRCDGVMVINSQSKLSGKLIYIQPIII